MVMFDNLEDIFQKLRDINEYSRALVSLATAIGILYVLYLTVKFVLLCIRDFRLYVLSQICNGTNLVKRYGEWAVISGSTDGIGLGYAHELAKRGHSIIVIGRNEEKLANTKAELEKEDNCGQVITVKIDLSDSSIANYDRIKAQIDPDNRDIGILINNAGFFSDKFGFFSNYDMPEMLSMINVNIAASVHLTRMILPGMLKRKRGLIATTSSILGTIDFPYFSIYGATKSFMNRMNSNLAMECANHNIDVINLTTGPVDTKTYRNSSHLEKSHFVISSPQYAKVVINALSTRIRQFSGCYSHELISYVISVFDALNLLAPLSRFQLGYAGKKFEPQPYVLQDPPSSDSN